MTRDTRRVLPDLSSSDKAYRPEDFGFGPARNGYVPNSLKALALGLPSLRLKIAKNRKRLRQAEANGDTFKAKKLREIIAQQETKASLTATKLAEAGVNIPVPEAPPTVRKPTFMVERKQKTYRTWSRK